MNVIYMVFSAKKQTPLHRVETTKWETHELPQRLPDHGIDVWVGGVSGRVGERVLRFGGGS